MNGIYEKLFEYVSGLTIIDSHEHLPRCEAEREQPTDVLKEYLTHYFSSDLRSVGMKQETLHLIRDEELPLMDRWALAEPYWELCRNTGYGRALDLAAREIYGVPRIERNTLEELNAKFLKTLEPGAQHFKRILRDMSRIEYSVIDSMPDCDRTYFRSMYSIDRFVMPDAWAAIDEIANGFGMQVTCLDEWLNACTAAINDVLNQGVVALKCSLAYRRSLQFDNADKQSAEIAFNDMLRARPGRIWDEGVFRTTKAFQDYMMHYILRLANERGLVFQFHTGLLEASSNYITNSDPMLLSNLFVQYPRVKFDLFHMGYPYYQLIQVLAKMYPNVYLDMCWAHILSPAASISALNEWLDSVPAGKIIAFGGDYCFVDGVYAHQLMARQNVTRVLAGKVQDGAFDLDAAKHIARRVFYENPKALFEG